MNPNFKLSSLWMARFMAYATPDEAGVFCAQRRATTTTTHKNSMNYKKLLQDPRWQKKRLKIMERDNFTCRDTGATDEQLQVHHCWYAKGSPWETPDEFLLTLSNDAHQHRQGLEQRAKKAFGRIMAKTPCHYDENQVLEHFVLQLEHQSERGGQLDLVIIDSEVIQELHDVGHSKQFHAILAEAMRIKASSLVEFLKNFAWVKKGADSE